MSPPKIKPMIDFSKIPKRKDKRPSPDSQDAASAASKSEGAGQGREDLDAQGLSFSQIKKDAASQEFKNQSAFKKSQQAYNSALTLVQEILTSPGAVPSVTADQIDTSLQALLSLVEADTQELLGFIFSGGDLAGHYLAFNMVNVCILALEVGFWLGLKHDELVSLGKAAFLHDVGMRSCLDVANSPRRLSLSEFQKIKGHPLEGSQILKRLKPDIDPRIISCVEQEHERDNGSGYPLGLKEEQISQWARIIGFCDVYEALTHPRPFRAAFTLQEAVKIILDSREIFSRRIIKAFLSRIGLYPKGTLVKLNTEDLAWVVGNNPRAPIGPMVKVVFDAKGKYLTAQRRIDLSRNPSFYII